MADIDLSDIDLSWLEEKEPQSTGTDFLLGAGRGIAKGIGRLATTPLEVVAMGNNALKGVLDIAETGTNYVVEQILGEKLAENSRLARGKAFEGVLPFFPPQKVPYPSEYVDALVDKILPAPNTLVGHIPEAILENMGISTGLKNLATNIGKGFATQGRNIPALVTALKDYTKWDKAMDVASGIAEGTFKENNPELAEIAGAVVPIGATTVKAAFPEALKQYYKMLAPEEVLDLIKKSPETLAKEHLSKVFPADSTDNIIIAEAKKRNLMGDAAALIDIDDPAHTTTKFLSKQDMLKEQALLKQLVGDKAVQDIYPIGKDIQDQLIDQATKARPLFPDEKKLITVTPEIKKAFKEASKDIKFWKKFELVDPNAFNLFVEKTKNIDQLPTLTIGEYQQILGGLTDIASSKAVSGGVIKKADKIKKALTNVAPAELTQFRNEYREYADQFLRPGKGGNAASAIVEIVKQKGTDTLALTPEDSFKLIQQIGVDDAKDIISKVGSKPIQNIFDNILVENFTKAVDGSDSAIDNMVKLFKEKKSLLGVIYDKESLSQMKNGILKAKRFQKTLKVQKHFPTEAYNVLPNISKLGLSANIRPPSGLKSIAQIAPYQKIPETITQKLFKINKLQLKQKEVNSIMLSMLTEGKWQNKLLSSDIKDLPILTKEIVRRATATDLNSGIEKTDDDQFWETLESQL